jgi:RNA polymerase sigma-70 factor, ECF subfamily
LATDKELSDFLKSVEKRAFKRAFYTVRDEQAALDIVQESMISLAEKYVDRPAAELPLIFQRILSNQAIDCLRKNKVKNSIFRNFSDFESNSENEDFDILEVLDNLSLAPSFPTPAETLSQSQVIQIIEKELNLLPARQREAFLLRYWEELDVSESAAVMGCSEGSVKTHCFRAVHTLANALRTRGITL